MARVGPRCSPSTGHLRAPSPIPRGHSWLHKHGASPKPSSQTPGVGVYTQSPNKLHPLVQLNNKDIKQYWLQYPSLRDASSHQQPAGLFTVDHKLLSPAVFTHLIESPSLSVPWRLRELKAWKSADDSNWQPCHREPPSMVRFTAAVTESQPIAQTPNCMLGQLSCCLKTPRCWTKAMPFPTSAVRWEVEMLKIG